ncbi:polysaccharide deacetylase family protein [Streptomyces sp. 4N509B]|uniref:polysaccharide deacetylase family protein n=1 Tax=Streptomyces sp. 4N509B TaxID=3457413 RepID=UPI003FD23321
MLRRAATLLVAWAATLQGIGAVHARQASLDGPDLAPVAQPLARTAAEGPALPPVPYALDALPPFAPAARSASLPLDVSRQRARIASRNAASALSAYADRLARAEKRRVAAVETWGLRRTPLIPPDPPDAEDLRPLRTEPGHVRGEGLPAVITRVPTDDKVVFLTIDDGAEKDPDLLRMLRELQIPFSGFLSHDSVGEDYGYFREAHADGAAMHNHSVNHLEMPTLGYAEQKREICDQQERLEREIGERPTLFRPPYGAYDRDTLRAAAACGVEVVPLWTQEAFADRIEWAYPDRKLRPGDIILTHFRGKGEWDDGGEGDMTDMLRRLVDTVTRQGFSVARLEDYLP